MEKKVVLLMTHDAARDLAEYALLMRPRLRVRYLHRFALVLAAPQVLDELASYCLRVVGRLDFTRYLRDVLDIWLAADIDGIAPRRRNRFDLSTRQSRESLSKEVLSW